MEKEDFAITLFMGFLIGFMIGFIFSPNKIISKQNLLKPYKIMIIESDTTFFYE
jgi:hypothetical protein